MTWRCTTPARATRREAVAAEIRAWAGRPQALQADLLEEAATAALVGRAAEALGGPLTVLVNNASIFEYDTIPAPPATAGTGTSGRTCARPSC